MPRLVVCHCDPAWIALAVCEPCEALEREALVRSRDALTAAGIAIAEAFSALVASYQLGEVG